MLPMKLLHSESNVWRRPSCMKIIESRHWCCSIWGATKFSSMFLYILAIPVQVTGPLRVVSSKKKGPRMNVAVNPHQTVTFDGNALRHSIEFSTAMMHPLQLYQECLCKGQSLIPVVGHQLLIVTNFVREKVHHFSQYIPHCAVGNTQV
ncbi:hypothetical protein TNCV_3993361 [Trichonephila clavipes]|uniref:Uncharacterized protein n=1 Tax=Trichonephila clavipes TaxID=2585209 RepID=A0A8X6VJQ1_TRICX|nr:hypothetical protein TNCV_3993361 [Trichonephila clavipes]